MSSRNFIAAFSLWLLSSFWFAPSALAQTAVLQRGYNPGVTGANLTETALSTTSVTASSFGMIFKLPVDDYVSAQPLYVPGVTVPNKGPPHNVLYVATMSNSLYAFDADIGGSPLWSINFGAPVVMSSIAFSSNKNIVGNLGVLGTPVIDPTTRVLYVVACALENKTMTYRLWAINIADGSEAHASVVISGGYASSTFDARYLLQRTALTLSGGQVILTFAAVELESPGDYEGWVIAYDEQSLVQSGIFATVTTGNLGGGVWQSGRPPVVDGSGYVYLFTGNGYGGGYDGVHDFSESALKLDPSKGLQLVDWFTPSNWSDMDTNDQDLSSSGPLLIPNTTPALLVGGGKTVYFYVLDTTNMGHNSDDTNKRFSITIKANRTGPVYWQRSSTKGGPLLFNWGVTDTVKSFSLSGNQLEGPVTQGSDAAMNPGGQLSISANADQVGSGILWATIVTGGDDQENPPAPGELRALNAENLAAADLWNSNMNSSRDSFGNFSKFAPPLVANGKVYIATWSDQVAVYGLLSSYKVSPTSLPFPSQTINVASASMAATVTNTGSAALSISGITLSGGNPGQFSQTNNCSSSVAAGGSCTVNVVFKPTTTGSKSATLEVNAGSTGTQSVALSGTGVQSPFTISPASLAFGNETLNVASAPMTATVKNAGSAAVSITSITLSGGNPGMFSQSNNCGSSVAASGSCTINVLFKPTSTGAKSATLNVNAGGGAGSLTAALTGTGVAPPYTLSPSTLAFGSETLNVASASKAATVTNTGSAALSITSIALSGNNPGQFAQTNNCGSSVAAGGSCTINVLFKPTVTGARSATLVVTAAGGAGTQSTALSGTGAAAPYTLSPTTLIFASQALNVASAPKTATVSNTGSAALSITSIALSGNNPGQFSQTNNCGSSVAAGGSCTIDVVFKPTTTGARSATLVVTAGGGAGTQSTALSGTGAAAPYTLSPSSLAFGTLAVGSTSGTMAVTLSNSGSAALSITSIALSGNNPGQFSQTNNCGSSVAAGASCTIDVVYKPTTTGAKSATLVVTAGGGAGTQSVALTGTGS